MDVEARPTYRIETLGGLSVSGGSAPLVGAATQRKTLLLLAVLASSSSQGISRDKLLGMFWPDSDTERARNALKQALHILRRDFREPELISGGPIVRLNPAVVSSDVQDFEAALEAGALERATNLYRGVFLDGLYLDGSAEFERWVERERGRLAHLHRNALEKLAVAARDAGDARRAADYWRRLAAADPLSSRVAVELMDALASAGDPEAALQHARVHEALVRQELDAPPDASVAETVERLREKLHTGRSREAGAARPTPGNHPESPTSPAQLEPRHGPDNREPGALVVDGPARLSTGGSRQALRAGGWRAIVASALRQPNRARLVAGLVLVATLVIAAIGASRMLAARAVAVERSVAVLPFIDIGGNPDDVYFSDGLSEELITALSRSEGLRVAARTSSFALRDSRLDVRAIGDTLGVAAVVEGSVRRTGGRLRVTAQLIDARSGYHLWSEAYDRDARDVFALQDEIARAIAGVLDHQSRRPAEPSAAHRTANSEAYDLYLRGTWFGNRLTRESIAKAIEYYNRAIALDSSYALAYAGKASAMGPLFYYRIIPRDPGLSEMRAAARKALDLDDRLGEAHVAMGVIHFFYEWDWPAAEREFRRATELNPGDPHAFHMMANWFRAMRRVDEAIVMRRRALEIDPLNGRTAISLARDYIAAGQYDLAAEQFRRGIDIDSLNPLVLGLGPGLPSGPGEVYERQGRMDAAVEEYLAVAARRGAGDAERSALRQAYARGGTRAFWSRWLAFEEGASSDPPRALLTAALLARMGETDRAIAALEQAYLERDPGLVYLATAPEWAELRQDARVAGLLERMRLPR